MANYGEFINTEIPWIGEIPSHWRVMRGKTILTLLSRPASDDDEIITCFRDGEVTLRKNRREDGFTVSLQEIGYQGIEPGDLVVHGMDGFAGAIGISDSRGKSTPVLNVMDSAENKRFLMFLCPYQPEFACGPAICVGTSCLSFLLYCRRWRNNLKLLRF